MLNAAILHDCCGLGPVVLWTGTSVIPPFKYSRRQFRGSNIEVRPDKAGASSRGNRPTTTKAESRVAWAASMSVIDCLKPADKAGRDVTTTPPGQRESEFTTSLRTSQFPRCRVSNQHEIQSLRRWRPKLSKFFLMNNGCECRSIFIPNNQVTQAA